MRNIWRAGVAVIMACAFLCQSFAGTSVGVWVCEANGETEATSKVSAVNRAKNVREMAAALGETARSVFYPEEIYACMIGRDFADEEAMMQEWTHRTDLVGQAPKVALYYGNEPKTALCAGEPTLEIAPILKEGITAVFALYHGGRLTGLDMCTADGKSRMVLSPGRTESTAEAKLLWFDDLASASSADFYSASKYSVFVSEQGNDETGMGTRKRPFRSVEKAKAYANGIKQDADSDVHVTFLPGTYTVTEPVTFGISDGGHGAYDVVYRGEPGAEKPLISGGVRVNPQGWSAYENGIYRVSVPEISEARQMYIDGVPAQRSATNGTYVATDNYQKEGSAYEEDGFILYNYNLPAVKKPSELEMVAQIKWVTQRVPVENMWTEGNKTYFTMDQPMYDSYVSAICSGGIQPIRGNEFYLENALEFIDEPGEFYFDEDEKMLYYYPYAEENLETAEVFLPKSQGIFRIAGTDTENRVKNLRFSHLDIRHGGWNSVNETGFCSFQADCMLEHNMHAVSADRRGLIPLAQIAIDYADGITVSDCRISNVGSTGIGMHNSASNCMVERNAIYDISGTGVAVGSWRYNQNTDPRTLCENITVQNNYITRIGQEHMGSLGIGVYIAKNVSVLHNDIKDVPYTGMSIGWNWSSNPVGDYAYGSHKIIGNRIDTIGLERKDGGQIYTLGNLSGTEIRENYLINSKDYGGIYLDSGSSYLTVAQNVVEKCQHWLFLNTTSGKDSLITGNYSDADNHGIVGQNKENYVLENTQFIEGGAWTGESAEIVEKSGIETKLRNVVEQPKPYPAWRKDLYAYIPRNESLASGEYIVEAEDFINEAGEGYYTSDGKAPVLYAQKDGYVVGNFGKAEWCKYRFSVKDSGVYRAEIRTTSGPNPTSKPNLVTLEVNDVPVLKEIVHAQTPSDWEYPYGSVLGLVELHAGENTVKVINEQGSWSFENLKFSLLEDAIYRIEAEDYIDEAGVGYFKKDGKAPVIYAQNKGHVIGNFYVSEWCKYNFSVKRAGTYRVEICAGSGPNPMTYPNLVTVEVDDVVAIEKAEHTKTPSAWNDLYDSAVGTITLTDAGEHTIKIINEQNAWTIDYIKLVLVAEAQ